jgi:hypothetical protein
MDDDIIRNSVRTVFEYSYLHDDWVYPLSEALDGVTFDQALWKPAPSSKCIWEIVLHMANWTENIVDRMHGDRQARPAEGPWPSMPDNRDADAWASARARLWKSLDTLRDEIGSTPMSTLLDRPWPDGTVLDDLMCRFVHNAYHIGQITKLRECMAG